MSLMCDHEQFRKPSVSFVGQMNDCAYFFEVRTAFACATINQAQALGPGAVFGAMYVPSHLIHTHLQMVANGCGNAWWAVWGCSQWFTWSAASSTNAP